MNSKSKLCRWLAQVSLLTAFSLACHAQSALTSTQALQYRSAADLHYSPDGSRLAYVVYSYQWDLRPRICILDVGSGKTSQITPTDKIERSPQWSPDGKALAFISNRGGDPEIYQVPAAGGDATVLTRRKYGVTSFHWSPDGRSIAYMSKDDDAPGANEGPQVADREGDLPRLWVLDLASTSSRRVGKIGYRIDEFQWQDSSHLMIVATDQPRVEEFTDAVYRVSIADGASELVSRPPQPVRGLLISPDAHQFALRATQAQGPIPRDLFVGTMGREDLRDVSAPPDLAVAEVKWNEQSTIWIRVVDGFFNRIWRLPPKGRPVPVNLTLSVNSFDVSRDGVIAFVGGDFAHLPEIYLREKNGHVRQVSHLQDGWANVALAPTAILRTKSFDGVQIEAALTRPISHPGEKLPLVLIVHGGPSSNFSAGYYWETAWAQLLAANGYQILMVNPRGSNGYSEHFMKANRGDLGGGDYKDLMSALDGVLAKGGTDPERLGIGGWSYGGEMSAWATTQTGRFKAAVAGAGVFDQQAEFETEDTPAEDEWQFGTPWEHPDVFARNSPISYIANAHTPTLILAGKDDTANPIGQSQGLYRALKHLGIETEMVTYPGEGHSPRRGSYNVDMFERILHWYDRFLKTSNQP
jgi:dipeptidyl aminopeptidase/acylaminoacyl peptidase